MVGARAESLRRYRQDKPHATIKEVMEVSRSLDGTTPGAVSCDWLRDELAPVTRHDRESAVHDDLER